ncbi:MULTISPECIES: hypothetical protein [Streptomyces]|uniref:hypothetical protein n=1 Tax=Streptomyces TaxID=1883 RepID=UPI001E31860A|nr:MULTISPECIES: hypothetical protein [Streptomyces]UFQ16454.1 hypothetical protein J2N69_16375 [Streptomyces huasconensis]WCL86056.1 hypothetical protein PPN52_16385 [Streptomyces sp. JCM 35825]
MASREIKPSPERAAELVFTDLTRSFGGIQVHPDGLELVKTGSDEWHVNLGSIPLHQAAKIARILKAARP